MRERGFTSPLVNAPIFSSAPANRNEGVREREREVERERER